MPKVLNIYIYIYIHIYIYIYIEFGNWHTEYDTTYKWSKNVKVLNNISCEYI